VQLRDDRVLNHHEEDVMTYRWIDDQGLLKKMLGERRIDRWTADNVQDALRARGVHAAARAMEYRRVRMETALRVLAVPEQRRKKLLA
jgi:hypothetical protein